MISKSILQGLAVFEAVDGSTFNCVYPPRSLLATLPEGGLTKTLLTALLLLTESCALGKAEFARRLLGLSNAQVRFHSGSDSFHQITKTPYLIDFRQPTLRALDGLI